MHAQDSETAATLAVRSDMPRWRGVPFVLRAAKGVETSRRHIEFRLAAPGFVRLEVLAGNLVIVPDGAEAPVEVAISTDTESASTRLLRAALVGDDTFTLSPDEPEEAWRIVECDGVSNGVLRCGSRLVQRTAHFSSRRTAARI